jgi:hypothetical protein
MNLQFFIWLEVQSLCQSAPVGGQHGGVEKKTPIDTSLTKADGGGPSGEPYVHRNQLFYRCKPDANKRKPPLTDRPESQ